MYDAIVIGARCAGAPTAMLLARRGHKVLLVDRSKFPSDVPHSTLWIHQPGCQLLKDWGLLDRVIATGCPPLRSWHFGFGPLVFRGSPPPAEGGQAEAYAPRRYLLDKILADAAAEAGAEFRDGVVVEEIVKEGDRVTGIRTKDGIERARIVIGAEGINSMVASTVGAPEYNVREALLSNCFTYFSGVQPHPDAQVEIYVTDYRAAYGWPTNDGKFLYGVMWKASELEEMKKDLEGNFFSTMESLAPGLHKRLRAAKRENDYIPGRLPRCFFRKAHGPGWALVGDAGASYEYSTAHGITNALRQAQLAADAIDAGLSGKRPIEDALDDFERIRDEVELPFYDFTYNQGTFQPLDAQTFAVYEAVSKSPKATLGFMGMFSQTVSPATFFTPENIAALMSGQL